MRSLLLISGNVNGRPTGGVTMHVHRLLKRLIEPRVKEYELCDYKTENLFKQLTKIKSADVMHIHASNPYLKLLYVVAGKLFKTQSIITLHGRYGVYGGWKDFIHKLALKYCDVPILINKESYEAVRTFNKRSVFIPAFIPPIEEEEVLPRGLENTIMRIKTDGKPLFVTNASSRAFTDDGREVYGIDSLISYFAGNAKYNLVVFDPSNDYTSFYGDRTPENVWLFSGKHSFCGLVKIADGVIRNTPTDGDSISVKEALFLHIPVLATDAVTRPKGVVLFKYADKDSLGRAIEEALSNKGEVHLEELDATELYYDLYHKLELA